MGNARYTYHSSAESTSFKSQKKCAVKEKTKYVFPVEVNPSFPWVYFLFCG